MFLRKVILKVNQAWYFFTRWAWKIPLNYMIWLCVYLDYFWPFFSREYVLFTKGLGKYYIRPKTGDISIANEIFLNTEYEFDYFSNDSKKIAIDVGAHIGLFAITTALKLNKVSVICYEPNKNNFSQLKRNIQLNNLEKNIKTYELAIGATAGTAKFYSRDFSAGYTICFELGMDELGDKKYKGKVKVASLTEEIERLNIKHVAILKMDCEGAEYEILHNLPEKIYSIIDTLFVECHTLETANVMITGGRLKEHIENLGFTVDITKYIEYAGILVFKCTRNGISTRY